MNSHTPLRLRTNIADYPATLAMKDGRVRSDLVELDFCGPKTAHQGFKPMLRQNAFEVGEIALATFLQARIQNKPYVLLPAPTVGKLQHKGIVYNSEHGILAPRDIEGRQVGVRSYTQTTGLWIRGVLQHSYGVNLDKVTWVTVEEAHVAEYQDPSHCLRVAETPTLTERMLSGELAAAMLGYGIPDDPGVTTLIPDADQAARQWYAQEGVIPLNHLIMVHEDLVRQHPDEVREIYRMVAESRRFAPDGGAQLPPLGLEPNRKALQMAIDWSYEQRIIPRRMAVDDLFSELTASLI